jgi:CHAT domain-containing protein
VAASFWPADDEATASLMTLFYQGIASGLTKAAALRAAQQGVRDLHPHPYHWAAFALTGQR